MNEIQFGTFDNNKKFVPGVSKEAAGNIVKYFGDWKITHVVNRQTNSIKNKKNYVSCYNNWKDIFDKRNHLISLFWNEKNKENLTIDLLLNHES